MVSGSVLQTPTSAAMESAPMTTEKMMPHSREPPTSPQAPRVTATPRRTPNGKEKPIRSRRRRRPCARRASASLCAVSSTAHHRDPHA